MHQCIGLYPSRGSARCDTRPIWLTRSCSVLMLSFLRSFNCSVSCKLDLSCMRHIALQRVAYSGLFIARCAVSLGAKSTQHETLVQAAQTECLSFVAMPIQRTTGDYEYRTSTVHSRRLQIRAVRRCVRVWPHDDLSCSHSYDTHSYTSLMRHESHDSKNVQISRCSGNAMLLRTFMQ